MLESAGAAGAMRLQGIMHAGAVLDSKVIANISAASIRAEFAGEKKGLGTLLLHRTTCMHRRTTH